MNRCLTQRLLTTLEAGKRRTDGGRNRRTDAWLLWMCVFLSRLPSKKTRSHASPGLLPYQTLSSFDTLFISVSLSLHLLPFMPPSFSPPDSFPLSLPLSDLLFTSLSDSLSPPLTPEIPPSAPGRLDLHQQCFPSEGKEIEWWIKEQSEETDKKLWEGQLYGYVKVFLHVVYCIGWHFTQSLCNPLKRLLPESICVKTGR